MELVTGICLFIAGAVIGAMLTALCVAASNDRDDYEDDDYSAEERND